MFVQRIKNIGHMMIAILANIYYRFPSREITVIGITGTDGKTTTANLIYHILKSAGKRVSIISTVSAVIGSQVHDTGFHVTTPSSFDVQKYLRQAVSDGSEYFILETTSHALDQYRVYGVEFDLAVITNITHEHLHYHGTFDKYVQSKSRLMQWSKKTFINKDDSSYESLLKYVGKSHIETYGIKESADHSIDISKKIGMPLARFNIYNYLVAYLICKELGLQDSEVIDHMRTFTLPAGRLEVVFQKEFTVIVDFAHTPNALYEALSSIRSTYVSNGRLIHVFGAAAFRDDEKRAPMGRESATYADLTILTEEDYRTEDPQDIAMQIAKGLEQEGFQKVNQDVFGTKTKQYTIIIDRQEAIAKACEVAKEGDVIVLTGKGHEMSLNRNGKEYHWNDKESVLQFLKES
ncbi:MAG: UDP-N-acetylmuramoyl-L-alanyl-D-glutamate--2,6-diaminopimelate ligase [Candidatus Roizmanbacteria bacterium]|nr:UDP-N-acetylmuramoyl-L-alanyl-D-glutamate--2,6-diaminopimelate ligase [Candidatus Roizmanbacteria bacterium]